LCNRPAQISGSQQASTASATAAGMIDKPAFISTVTQAENLGLNPVLKERTSHASKKSKVDDVTWRHKRWLAEFQEKQNELAELMEEKQKEVDDRKQRFGEKQKAKRAAMMLVREEDLGDEGFKSALEGTLELGDKKSAAAPGEKTKKMKKTKKAPKGKPKWAMTFDENEDVEDLEVDDLVNFATNLDFDDYLDDLEVREAMQFVQTRVEDLEKQKSEKEAAFAKEMKEALAEEGGGEEVEEGGDGEEGDKLSLADRVAAHKKRIAEKTTDDKENGDAASVATGMSVASHMSTESRLLDEGGLKGVHSAASVRQLMKQTKKTSSLPQISEGRNPGPGFPAPNPVVATTKARGSLTTDPSNLPYLFRHPAV
jgi:hypothetical protein